MTSWWRRRAATIQQRLTLLTTVAVFVGVMVTCVAAWVLTRWTMYDQLDQELTGIAASLREPIINDLESMGGLNADALRTANVTLAIVGADGLVTRVPGESRTLVITSAETTVARRQAGSSARSGTATDGTTYRIVSLPLASPTTGNFVGAYALVIARPLQPTEAVLSQLWMVMAVFGTLAAVAAAALGWWVLDKACGLCGL